jgi:hypothetical protein
MKIHLYALCFNEEKMLPHFFRHYDSIVDRYFIIDNDSKDESLKILRKHPKVILKSTKINGSSFVLGALSIYNQLWKISRGSADWVIVCNIDEFLYHNINIWNYLEESQSRGETIITPEGYEMVSDFFPKDNHPLTEQIRKGVRNRKFDKPQLFKPDSIQEINFAPGRHTAEPQGAIQYPVKSEVKLLHYKHLGKDYYLNRQSELALGLRSDDLVRKFGIHYLWDENRKIEHFDKLLETCSQVI